MPKPTRFTAPLFLLPTVFIAQVMCYQVAYFTRWSWHEDRSGPLTATAEWKPYRTYTPEIERSLALLSHSDPDKVRYLRERGIPIHILTAQQMAVSGCPAGSLGCTRHADSSINVISVAGSDSTALAVVLSHELTHCQIHDAVRGSSPVSTWKHLLWRGEEANAHVAGLATAWDLRLPLRGGPLSGWWLEYLVWFWPAGTFLLSGLISVYCFHLIMQYIKRHAIRRAPDSPGRGQSESPSSYSASPVKPATL